MKRANIVRRVVLMAVVACVVAGCGGAPASRAGQAGERADEPQTWGANASGRAGESRAESGRAARELVVVDVSGAVRRPGVFRLPRDARVYDAIAAAGGATFAADLTSLNRAGPVVDGQQIIVARLNAGAPVAGQAAGGGSGGGAGAGAGATGSATAGATARISINSADAALLEQLPGIGPVTAAAIVADRASNGPFTSIDDLDRVKGIGTATVDGLRDAATV